MDIVSIQLANFFSHRNTDIRLAGGLVGVFGPNGAGKSSLITDSVTWCLWGKSRVGGAGDACISTGQSFCEVILTFRVNGILWKVTRTRARDSKTVLELSTWKADRWHDLTGPVIKDTQVAITNLLGMSYEVFQNSSCIEQGQANSFSNLTPSEAASVILDILQLNKYKRYRQCASEKAAILERTISGLEASITSLEVQLESYQESSKTYQEKLQKLTVIQPQYETATSELTKVETKEQLILEQLSKLAKIKATLDAKFHLTTEQLSKQDVQLKVLSEKSEGQCPLCKTTFTTDSLADSRETTQKTIGNLKSEQQCIHTDLLANESKIADCESQLRLLKADLQRSYAKNLEKEFNTLQAETTAFGATVTSLDSISGALTETREQHTVAVKNLETYTSLQEAFGPKGIPLLVVDNVVKELEVAINNNLKLLADLPLSIGIATQHEGKQGDMVDTFEIVLNDGLETKPYVNYSGGEKMLIDLAIRLGLSELLAKRNNFKVETLIIDEGLGSLDEVNQLNFFATLAKLESKFRHILVITHTQVKDCFKQRIELKKVNGVTVVDKQVTFRV